MYQVFFKRSLLLVFVFCSHFSNAEQINSEEINQIIFSIRQESSKTEYAKAIFDYTLNYREKIGSEVFLALLHESSQLGYTPATMRLASIYQYGFHDVPIDLQKTFKLYQKAAKEGDKKALFSVAYSYENGQGVAQDTSKAFRIYSRMAEKNYAPALNALAYIYAYGKYGFLKDISKAFELFSLAAKQDYAPALNALAYFYENGRGVALDIKRAFRLYLKASLLGNGAAAGNLGYLYEQGKGVEKDMDKAINFYKQASDKGHILSQLNLAYIYANGRGTPVDYLEAKKWIDLVTSRENFFNLSKKKQRDAQRLKKFIYKKLEQKQNVTVNRLVPKTQRNRYLRHNTHIYSRGRADQSCQRTLSRY